MVKKSEKGASKPSKARTWDRTDIFKSFPQGPIERDQGAESSDRRTGLKKRLRRSRAFEATWMLPRIDTLRDFLGEPPASIKKLESALQADFNYEVADGRKLKLKDQQEFLSKDDFEKILKIASIGDAERERCFSILLTFQNPRRLLQQLFSDYEDLLYNYDVTSEPRNNFGKENVVHEFRSKSDRPRWAEENRTGVRFAMRISENLLSEIDTQAKQSGITRTDWIVGAVESFIQNSGRKEPPDSPEFKSTRPIGIRISEELSNKINSEAERHGLSKTEYVRRIARHRLAEPSSHLERKFER